MNSEDNKAGRTAASKHCFFVALEFFWIYLSKEPNVSNV